MRITSDIIFTGLLVLLLVFLGWLAGMVMLNNGAREEFMAEGSAAGNANYVCVAMWRSGAH